MLVGVAAEPVARAVRVLVAATGAGVVPGGAALEVVGFDGDRGTALVLPLLGAPLVQTRTARAGHEARYATPAGLVPIFRRATVVPPIGADVAPARLALSRRFALFAFLGGARAPQAEELPIPFPPCLCAIAGDAAAAAPSASPVLPVEELAAAPVLAGVRAHGGDAVHEIHRMVASVPPVMTKAFVPTRAYLVESNGLLTSAVGDRADVGRRRAVRDVPGGAGDDAPLRVVEARRGMVREGLVCVAHEEAGPVLEIGGAARVTAVLP